MLDQLSCAGTKLAITKGQWFHTKVVYVGLTVGADESQEDLSHPRQVIGVCNYSQQFTEDYTVITRPLTGLLGKDKHFEWGENHEQSFCQNKEKLCSAPSLANSDNL